MGRAFTYLTALVVAFVGALPPAFATATRADALVAFVHPGDSCTSSKTVFVAVDRGGVHSLKCEGRAYNGPLSGSQYLTVFKLARDLWSQSKRGALSDRDRRRIRRYATAVAHGENTAEFDKSAATAEIGFMMEAFFHDVGHNRRGRFYLNPDFHTRKETKREVVRALTSLVESGDALRPVIETLFEKRPHGGPFIFQEPVFATSQSTKFAVPPRAARGMTEISIDAFLDPAITGCVPEELRAGASIPNYLCTFQLVFVAQRGWKISQATFRALFALAPADASTTTTS